jgi:hypothetical protein
MSPKRQGGAAGRCAKQEQFRLDIMWNAPAAGSMQFINVSLGTHLSAPRGLSAFTIEPATWKHQQPDGTTRQPGKRACQPSSTVSGFFCG